jgi:hypothetical protein
MEAIAPQRVEPLPRIRRVDEILGEILEECPLRFHFPPPFRSRVNAQEV